MKHLAALCATAGIALMMTACQPADTHGADVKALKDNEAQWNQDYVSKDPANLRLTMRTTPS